MDVGDGNVVQMFLIVDGCEEFGFVEDVEEFWYFLDEIEEGVEV